MKHCPPHRCPKTRGSAIATLLGALVLGCCTPPPAPAADTAALPKAETILDRYVQVTGGKAAYEQRTSEIATGTLEYTAQGIKGALSRYSQAPDNEYTSVDIPGVGKLEQGVSGGVAWEKSALLGARIKSGEERAQALREARIDSTYHWREVYAKAETTSLEPVDGEECYKVVMTPAEGKPDTLYFSKKTGLLKKTVVIAASQMGDIPAQVTAVAYRDFGGILEPSVIKQTAAGQEFTITIENVEVNPKIPPQRFALPDDVKALLKTAQKVQPAQK
jgi:hypothetical protein